MANGVEVRGDEGLGVGFGGEGGVSFSVQTLTLSILLWEKRLEEKRAGGLSREKGLKSASLAGISGGRMKG